MAGFSSLGSEQRHKVESKEGQGRYRQEQGEDLNYTMKVGFGDAIHGLQTRIRLSRLVACDRCGGRLTRRPDDNRTTIEARLAARSDHDPASFAAIQRDVAADRRDGARRSGQQETQHGKLGGAAS
jgi:hypothetical protein